MMEPLIDVIEQRKHEQQNADAQRDGVNNSCRQGQKFG